MSTETHIAIGLSKIGLLIRSTAWRRGGRTGLTPTQAQILAHLAARGPSRIGALAEEMAITQPTASGAVSALIRKGHVRKQPDPADARAARLQATQSGRRLAAEMAAWPDALLSALGELDPAEQGALMRALFKMIRALQDRGAIPVQRMCATCRYFRPYAHSDAARPHHCNFVDAPFGDAALRLDCADHGEAEPKARLDRWARFKEGPVAT